MEPLWRGTILWKEIDRGLIFVLCVREKRKPSIICFSVVHITKISGRSWCNAWGCMYHNFLQLQNIFGHLGDVCSSIKAKGFFEIQQRRLFSREFGGNETTECILNRQDHPIKLFIYAYRSFLTSWISSKVPLAKASCAYSRACLTIFLTQHLALPTLLQKDKRVSSSRSLWNDYTDEIL